ncbi:MAG TPA: Rieske (2Fe-2S) protein [Puia sp.]|nr:Rieske (2Fe-2S) protein [Puia sp.]
MERRTFLKTSCNFCLLGMTGGLLSQLEACSPTFQVTRADIVGGSLTIPLATFTQSGLQIIRPNGWYYNIAVHKKTDGSYESMLLQCTHQQNQLAPTGNGFTCTLHGSQFDAEGQVKKGPAERSLKKFPTSLDGDKLIIHLNT